MSPFNFFKSSYVCSIVNFSFCLTFLSSCVLYPRYQRPCMEMPDHWRVTSHETSTVINVKWWEKFQDPLLNDLILEALDNNKDIKVATARIAEFRAQLGIVTSQLYPQIFAQTDLSRQRISQKTAGSFFLDTPSQQVVENQNVNNYRGNGLGLGNISPYSNDYLAVLNASYELDLWGKLRSATEASYADLLGEINARRTVILSIVSSVATAYIQLRQYDRQLIVSLQTLASRQSSFDIANIRFKEGLTSELEVKQAASEREEAALQVIQFQTLIPQQENLLSILLGHPPQKIERGNEVDGWQLPFEVPAGLPIDLLEQRPDILQAEEKLKAANYKIGEARAEYFPDITLTGYYGYESAQLHELFTNPARTWQWMFNLLQPLFTGGRIYNQVALAKSQKREAAYLYLQVILEALKEVDNALIAHRNSKEAHGVQYTRVEELQAYVQLARIQYENGLVDYLNVLDAERRLFDAQLDLAKNQADVFLTLINIYKALGGGWVIEAEETVDQSK